MPAFAFDFAILYIHKPEFLHWNNWTLLYEHCFLGVNIGDWALLFDGVGEREGDGRRGGKGGGVGKHLCTIYTIK